MRRRNRREEEEEGDSSWKGGGGKLGKEEKVGEVVRRKGEEAEGEVERGNGGMHDNYRLCFVCFSDICGRLFLKEFTCARTRTIETRLQFRSSVLLY